MLDYQRLFLAMDFFVPKIQESKLEESGDLWNHPNRHGFLKSFPLPILASFFGVQMYLVLGQTRIYALQLMTPRFYWGASGWLQHVLKKNKTIGLSNWTILLVPSFEKPFGSFSKLRYCSLLFCSPWVSPQKTSSLTWMVPWGCSWLWGFHRCRQSCFFLETIPKKHPNIVSIISYDSWSFIIQRFNQHFAHINCPHILSISFEKPMGFSWKVGRKAGRRLPSWPRPKRYPWAVEDEVSEELVGNHGGFLWRFVEDISGNVNPGFC